MLQMNQKALEAYNAENIQNLVDRIAPILEYRREMYKRYSRKNGLYEIIGDDGQKKTVPFEYYIANMVTGYLSGKAPQYNVRCRNCGEGGAHDGRAASGEACHHELSRGQERDVHGRK